MTATYEFDKELDAASYNGFAQAYDYYINRLASDLADRICELAQIQNGDRVLDIGCGTGLATRKAAQLAGAGGFVLGIDLSQGMLAQCQSALPETPTHYARMDAESLQVPNCSFDKVISLNAVLHFPNIHRATREMYRVLKNGGLLALSFGSGRPLHGWSLLRFSVQHGLRQVKKLVRPCLRAPHDLTRMIEEIAPPQNGVSIHTHWSSHHPDHQIVRSLQAAGFIQIRRGWRGRMIQFSNPEEFWEAQLAIVTPVRRRLQKISFRQAEDLRAQFLARAEDVLNRGGQLVYPYGALFTWAKKPETESVACGRVPH